MLPRKVANSHEENRLQNEGNILSSINKIYKIPIIDKQDLPSIYKTCDILLFPSLYEGMGILPMEAMKIGIPVVTSNTSSIPEIVGDAAIQCDPRDVNEITKKIAHLLTNDNFYDQKVKDGLERSKKFDYDKMHKQIINLYKEELSKKILEKEEEFALIDSYDSGNALTGMRKDVKETVNNIRYFCGLVREVKGETFSMEKNHLNFNIYYFIDKLFC